MASYFIWSHLQGAVPVLLFSGMPAGGLNKTVSSASCGPHENRE